MARIYHTWQGFYPGPSYVTDGLVSYWDASVAASYPGTGTDVFDLVSDNNGTLNGSIYNSDGDGSFLFDGINDSIQANNNLSNYLNDGEAFSVSVWYKNTKINFGYYSIFSVGNFLDYIVINIFNLNTVSSTLRLDRRKNVSGIPNDYVTELITGVQSNNVWNNATLVMNDAGNTIYLYLNGVELGNLITTIPLTIPTFPMVLGTSLFSYRLSGYIANSFVYNKALSSAEVAQNYNALKTRFGL